MNRRVLLAVLAALAIVGVFGVVLWGMYGSSAARWTEADSLRVVTQGRAAAWEQAAAWARDSALATLPDSAARAARDDSLVRAGARQAERARARAVEGASELGEALAAAGMDVWVPVLDGIIAAKDEEREAEVAAREAVIRAQRVDYASLERLFVRTVDSLIVVGDSMRVAADVEVAFLRQELARLESIPRFQIKAPLGVAVAVAGGFALGVVVAR